MISRARFGKFLAAAAFQRRFGGRLVRVASGVYFVFWECNR